MSKQSCPYQILNYHKALTISQYEGRFLIITLHLCFILWDWTHTHSFYYVNVWSWWVSEWCKLLLLKWRSDRHVIYKDEGYMVNLEVVRNWKPTFIRDFFISLFVNVKMVGNMDKSLQQRFMTHSMISIYSIIHFFKKPFISAKTNNNI